MMNVMHGCEPYGYLCENGRPMTDERIARRCGTTLPEYSALLAELDAAGIPRRTKSGIIFSKRMVEDEKQRKEWNKRQKKHRVAGRDVTQVSRESHPVLHSASPSPFPEEETHTERVTPLGSPQFKDFFEQYPIQTGRKAALAEWCKQMLDDSFHKVMASLGIWKACERWQNPQYIPYPAKWLSDQWRSEPVKGVSKNEQKRAGTKQAIERVRAGLGG